MWEATADMEEQGAICAWHGSAGTFQGMGTTGSGAVSAFLKQAAEEDNRNRAQYVPN